MSISHTECCENMLFMSGFEDNFFDLAVVDPEWGIGAGKKKQYHKGAFTTYRERDWDLKRPSEEYFKELFRVSKNQIIWGANYFTDLLPPAKNWIVWDKSQPAGISFSMHELAFNSCEGQAMIFRITNGSNGNRCVIKSKVSNKRIHQTQKPVSLYAETYKWFSQPGFKILDTHLGSGTNRIAAYDAGLDFYACEIDEEMFIDQENYFATHIAQQKLFSPQQLHAEQIQLL
jgi:site-specific DNA-methyltransferase (adenine-specific)